MSQIQKQILHKAIESPLFSKEVLPRAPLTMFEGNDVYKEIANIVKRYYQTNRDVLTEDTLLTLTEDKLYRMKKKPEEQQEYFNAINELYEIRNSNDDSVIDEKIESYIRKHMRMELLKKAAVNLENEEFMEDFDKQFKEIMLLDISGKQQEIINVIDDTELKRKALSTIYQNTISTGFKELDYLNGGGLAKGELGMIVAASGTGKCIVGDTLIYTEKGIIEIQDIPNHFCVDPHTNESKAKVASYTKQGEYTPRHTSHWYNLGKSKTLRVTTKSGYSVEGTPEHPLLVMNRNGDMEYKELQNMEPGDYLTLAKSNMWSDTDRVSEEEAYMMALLVADGHLATKTRIDFSNSNKDIVKYYKDQADKLWGIQNVYSVEKEGSNTIDHTFSSVEVKKELEEKGLKMVKSPEKEIPYTVLQSTKPVIRRFVQGMFDTEGSIYKGSLELTTASKRLAEQLQVVLLNFGIRTSLRPKKVKGYEQNNYYRLSITGLALRQFQKEIGFRLNIENKERLEEAIKIGTNTNVEVTPYQGERLRRIKDNHFKGESFWDGHTQKLDGKRLNAYFYNRTNPSKQTIDYILSYTEHDDDDTLFLKNATENFIFEPIEVIEESESVVYDFTVPETHSFVANGIVSHNTLLLTNLATNYTKLKYNVLYIALEELENRMILRFEQSMLRQNKSDILTGRALNEDRFNKLQDFYKKNREKFGNLFFARYSPRTITPAKIEQLISDVTLRMGITIDVIVIDYPELLRNPHATGSEAEDGGKLFEEMRRIGQDYNAVMWTAAQMNRTAYSAQIRTAEHMEGSHRKKNAAELVLTVNQTPEEYNAGFIRLYADKVRNPPEGAYNKMVGLKVVGSAMTVRDYKDEREKNEHISVLEEADNRMESEVKGKKREKQSNQSTPDWASEINNSILQSREGS